MAITFRPYQDARDLQLQIAFWNRRTRDLPLCWKATRSPQLYVNSQQFDPRSRYFAFDGSRLVGYMSFTGQGEFVSLGYPWVVPGYEGELQERLYEHVYGFAASSEYGGTVFAQRFRSGWDYQVSFFEQHGFRIERKDPLFLLDLESGERTGAAGECGSHPGCTIETEEQFNWETFQRLSAHLPQQTLDMYHTYFESVEFDFTIKGTIRGGLAAYLGFTIRQDTGVGELVTIATDAEEQELFAACLTRAIRELSKKRACRLTSKAFSVANGISVLTELGFASAGEELLMVKKLDDTSKLL